MSSIRLQDTRSIYENQLFFNTVAKSKPKIKLRKIIPRKTITQRREEEEEIISQVSKKTEIESNDQKALFKNIEIEKNKKNATKEEVIEYFQKNAIGKQGSFYLNADLMKLLRTKSVQDDLSIAEVVRKLLLKHYFTEEELKELYLKNNF